MKIPSSDGIIENRQTAGAMSSSASSFATSAFSMASSIANTYLDQRAEGEVQEAKNNLIRKHNDLQLKVKERQGKDALGSTAEIEKEAQALESEVLSGLSGRAKNKFGDFGIRISEQSRVTAMMHEAEQEKKYKTDIFNQGTTLAEEMVRMDAKNWRQAAGHLNETLEGGLRSGLFREDEFEARATEMRNKFRNETAKSYYTQDKHSFMKEINELGFGKPEIEFWKSKYQDDLQAEEREKKSLFNEEAKLIMGMREDMKAQAIANQETIHFKSNADKLEKMGFKEWASELREDAALYDKTIAFESKHKNATLSEMVKSVSEMKVSDELAGSGIELKAQQTIKAEVQKKVKVFNSDPAEFVKSFAVGTNMEEIASSRVSLQKSQGIIPSSGYKVLTKSESESYKAQWESGDIKQRTAMVSDINKFGKHAPKVLSELEVNGALSLAPFLENERDLELMIAGTDKAVITDSGATPREFKDAAKSSKFYKILAETQAEFPTDLKLSKKLADIEKTMFGISAKKNDRKAGADFFDERFEVEKDTDKMIFFPKTMDSDEVIGALDKKKKQIAESINLSDEGAKQSAKWAVRDYTWINSSSGFVLANKKTGRAVPGSLVEYAEVSDLFRMDLAKKKSKPERVTASAALMNILNQN